VRPWLWLLTRRTDCRVFQGKTVPQIFELVCRHAGYADYKMELSRTYEAREHCVQYRETDFQFLSRLLEQEGSFYFFEHSRERHVLVLCDDVARLTTAPGYDSVPYFPPEETDAVRERDHLSSWRFQKSIQPGLTTASHVSGRGSGDAVGIAAGKLFALANHPRPDLNIQYLVTSTSLEASSDAHRAGAGSEGTQLAIRVEAMDAREAYRPARVTPKPVVQGTQIAKVVGPESVVGPEGEDIHTDDSRVKVQFHWNADGTPDEKSSCWVRVGQAWTGQNGTRAELPPVGQEVIVSFLEGDPDRPLIIGSVYSGGAKRSEDGDDKTTFAQNHKVDIRENQQLDVRGNQTLRVGRNQTIDVDENHTSKIGKNMRIDAGDTVTITNGTASLTLDKDGNIVIKGRNITVDGGGPINVNSSKNIILKGDKILQN
jgi:type VI secretion system secreted protein VgrG